VETEKYLINVDFIRLRSILFYQDRFDYYNNIFGIDS